MGITLEEFVNIIGFDIDEKQLKSVEKRLDDTFKKMESFGKKMSLMVTAPIVGAGIMSLKTAGEFEMMEVAFSTMLGSAEHAKVMMKDLMDFTAKTPFQIKDVAGTTKQLLAYGIEAENVMTHMRHLGDVSAGLNVPIQQMADVFGQIRSEGRMTGETLRRFTRAGVPMLQTLADMYGVTTAEIREMSSRGQISFKDVSTAFEMMAGEGGRFANLMEKEMDTLLGTWSNFRDNVTLFLADIGSKILPFAKRVIGAFSGMMEFVSGLSSEVLMAGLAFAGVLAMIGPATLLFVKLAKAGKLLIVMWNLLTLAKIKAAIATVIATAGLALIPIAIIAVIGMIWLLIDELHAWFNGQESILNDVIGEWSHWSEVMDHFIMGVVEDWYAMTDAIGKEWELTGDWIEGVFFVIIDGWYRMTGRLRSLWSEFMDWLMGMGERINDFIEGLIPDWLQGAVGGLLRAGGRLLGGGGQAPETGLRNQSTTMDNSRHAQINVNVPAGMSQEQGRAMDNSLRNIVREEMGGQIDSAIIQMAGT